MRNPRDSYEGAALWGLEVATSSKKLNARSASQTAMQPSQEMGFAPQLASAPKLGMLHLNSSRGPNSQPQHDGN
jgi:hypothetical protein